jgi:hypothetical protein
MARKEQKKPVPDVAVAAKIETELVDLVLIF